MSHKFPTITRGLAGEFHPTGELIQWVHNDFIPLDDNFKNLHSMIVGDENKLRDFLQKIREQNGAFGWEFAIRCGQEYERLHFLGVPCANGLFIAASVIPGELLGAMQELVRMNNEQTTALRQALKELSMERDRKGTDDHLYEEMSRLNNELVNLQRELTRKNQELARLNDLKNRFFGMASHDLRKPLSVILMNVEQLQGEALPSAAAAPIASIEEMTRDVLHALSDFLDQASIDAGQFRINPASVDLCRLLREREPIWSFWAARKKKQVELICAEGTMILSGDERRLKQVLDNLIENGLKYSGTCNRLTVTLCRDEIHAILNVKDEGPGLSEQAKKSLFQAFASERIRGGEGEKDSTGLGLAICKAVVEAHGGTIRVESSSATGTNFEIRLPLNR